MAGALSRLQHIPACFILVPLAITSTKGWMHRLGKKWKWLHYGVYLAAILVIVHFVWLVKADIRRPLPYGAVVALLLLARLPVFRRTITKFRSRFKLAKSTAR